MLKRLLRIALTPWLCVAGCFGGDTGTESDWPVCGERGAEMKLGADEQTVRGSARELATRATVESDGALVYWQIEGGQSVRHDTTAHVRVLPDPNSARLVAKTDRHDRTRVCEPQLELDALIELESADGAFRERFAGTLGGDERDHSAGASARTDYTKREGSYQTEAFAGEKVLEYSLQVRLEDAAPGTSLSDPHWKGQLYLEAPQRKNAVSAEVAEW